MGLFKKIAQAASNLYHKPLNTIVNAAEDVTKFQLTGVGGLTAPVKGVSDNIKGAINDKLGIQNFDVTQPMNALGVADPTAIVKQSPEELAKQEEERKRLAKISSEKTLLAEYPGRGGILNGAPTFRFM